MYSGEGGILMGGRILSAVVGVVEGWGHLIEWHLRFWLKYRKSTGTWFGWCMVWVVCTLMKEN